MKFKNVYQTAFPLLVILFIVSCNSVSNQKTIEGLWERNGYGTLLEITDTEIKFYDFTKMSCILNTTLKRSEIRRLGELNLIANDTLTQTLGITEYSFKRINSIPKVLVDTSSNMKKQLFNFDVFWHTLDENYAFFSERNVDWDSIYKEYRPEISEKTTDKELYEMLINITDGLKDEHTTILAPEEVTESQEDSIENNLGDHIEESNIDMKAVEISILKKYVENPKIFGKDMKGKGLFNWGSINDNVGYLQVNNMLFFADYVIPDSLNGYDYLFAYLDQSNSNPLYQEHEVEGASKLMDSIVDEFQDMEAIILDVRFNLGGYDVVSMEILSHFVKEKTLVFSKKARMGNGFTKPQKIYVYPSESIFDKPVFLLTSHQTSSAPESLAMGSMAVPSITRIGSNTMGILSDILEKKLPNGWDLYLSNEVFQNFKGDVAENIGIAADIPIDYPDGEQEFSFELYKDLDQGDKAIEIALKKIIESKSEIDQLK